MTLPDFLQLHSNSFPTQFLVTRCSDSTISVRAGDHCTALSLETVKALFLRDSAGDELALSLRSEAHLGLIYDPNNSLSAAYLGYEFETAEDVMNASVKPKLLRASKSDHSAGRDAKSVDREELLVLRKVKSNHLKVYSVTKKKEKTLPRTCRGGFTTAPHKVAMSLLDILEHVPDAFLSKAALILGGSLASEYRRWVAEPVTIFRSGEENVLIAKRITGEYADIPISPNIYVQIIQHEDIKVSEQTFLYVFEDTSQHSTPKQRRI